ncbi:Hypothetical protein NTJ_14763 [Nesidiocoris tenuis]|uniref:Uncharacterized protein n=1 Tax=Nesidiocoris tenuis TaxID=355587 RepID=A0ABN7BDL7_9HEMI|nr:Hypothetical protein NTJ_14763 [Nesidiocoris tenuis]
MVSPTRLTDRENLQGRINFNHPAAMKDRNLQLPKQPSTPLGDVGNRLNVVRQIFAKDSSIAAKNEGPNFKQLPKSDKVTAEPVLPNDDTDSIWSAPLAYTEIEDLYQDVIPLSLRPTQKDISNLVYANPGPRKYFDENSILDSIDPKDIWKSSRDEEIRRFAESLMEMEHDVPTISPPLELDFSFD